MLRWILPLAVTLSAISIALLAIPIALFAIPPADAADNPAPAKPATVRAARQLPPGLPRRHYAYRTTITPPRRAPKVIPLNAKPIIPYVVGEPLLPGSSSLPGYYGNARSYSYTGPYYGGAYVEYWDRLPFACGIYGYC